MIASYKIKSWFFQHGNYTILLGPQIDTYLPSSMRYITSNPKLQLESGNYPNIPIMLGICSNEGAFMEGQMKAISYSFLTAFGIILILFCSFFPYDQQSFG